jgi:hypothetical protein
MSGIDVESAYFHFLGCKFCMLVSYCFLQVRCKGTKFFPIFKNYSLKGAIPRLKHMNGSHSPCRFFAQRTCILLPTS